MSILPKGDARLRACALLLLAMRPPAHALEPENPPADAPAPVEVSANLVPTVLDTVVVTATRERDKLYETPASIGVVSGRTIGQDHPTHPSQVLGLVPGAAVAITNGEGHTTAIRQPFTTAAVYQFLEDGVPIRSTGFFNHNALYEVNVPQADAVEVVRGPGSALYGSDAIGGVVNVLTRPSAGAAASVSTEAGEYGWSRLLVDAGDLFGGGRQAVRGSLNVTRADGWRDATQYDRQSGTLRWDSVLSGESRLSSVLSFSRIDQQTGANSPLKEDDYRGNPTENYQPIAFRKVDAVRLSSAYERDVGDDLLSLTPYLRDDRMELLASFMLNYDPTRSVDANRSIGLLAKWRRDFPGAWRGRLIAGADIDYSPGGREEDALAVTASGAAPARRFSDWSALARIYDYDVAFLGLSPYVHGELSPTERLRLTAGLRFDALSYDFDNHLAPGTIQVPGAAAPHNFPAGSRYYDQGGDVRRRFERFSPKLGATFALTERHHAYASYNFGFRAPSQSQLFRPSAASGAPQAQASRASALGLEAVKAEQLELGLRGQLAAVSYDLAVYRLAKRDDIVSRRDPVTTLSQAVNAGETLHRGVELGVGAPLFAGLRLDLAASHARHRYEDWVSGSTDYSGKEMETAPHTVGNALLSWNAADGSRLLLEWVKLGAYWLDAANTQRYDGHSVVNLRGNWTAGRHVALFASVHNVTDRRYADSASLSNNRPVLSPGLPRTAYAGVELSW